jgi:hypothetical protein
MARACARALRCWVHVGFREPPCESQATSSDLPSNRFFKAKQELVGVTADGRVEHIFGVIVGLVRQN